MPQTKKWGEVEAQCFIKIGKRKKNVGLKIKLSEKREHCVYFYLYKSKYSTINIQFSYLNFKNFHPNVQNNVRNCVQHKQKPRQKTYKKVGEYNSLLIHFICRVIMISSIPGFGTMGTGMGTGTSPACQESRVRVRDQVHGYRYKLTYPNEYEYGYG